MIKNEDEYLLERGDFSNKVWEYFNIKVLTIETGDKKRIRQELNKVGIKNSKINIFKGAKKRKNDGKKDLTLIDIFKHSHYDETSINLTSNHIKIIDNAYKRKLENILIFEDDFVFINFDIKKLERIVEWLKSNEWDVFYFGQCGWPIFLSIPIKKDIVKVFTPLMAHSYVLSREGMRKVLEYYNGNEMLHFDKLLCNATKNKYASFPSIVHQNVAPALYSKALRKMNLPHIDHIKFFTFTDYFSISIFIIVVMVLIFLTKKILIRKK